ncbi:sensor histidine kinase [Peribacillus glennii]|uniref:Sensor histidine kinase n=1 Tax=Peribacillus glennii TaxID=2303991 RepID=A0A372LEV6_9BACI|nr:histidine kinase [Peribacillus glennii]RFU64853.1 sensor histidine kinase [Peribacillus glennii]
MNATIFTFIILAAIGLPIGGFVLLLLLDFFEREFDYLQLENKRIKLEKELQKMEYLQLNQQIQPHFLFNSLNAMLSLGRLGRTVEVVEAMEEFSQFLRYKYKDKDALVPFFLELEYTKHYISIQQLRFGRNLQVSYLIDQYAEQTLLPPYILQSFVENAFKHGLERKSGEKLLHIELKRYGNWVRLSVKDNGPDEKPEQEEKSGVGLANIRKRLKLIYDLRTSVKLGRIDAFTIVTAEWPYSPGGNGK